VTNYSAEANRAWVQDRIKSRGWSRQIDVMACLAIACGFTTWWTCQLQMDLDDAGLGGLTKSDLTKELLKISPKLRTSGEWAS
jgi:hypothetical protein